MTQATVSRVARASRPRVSRTSCPRECKHTLCSPRRHLACVMAMHILNLLRCNPLHLSSLFSTIEYCSVLLDSAWYFLSFCEHLSIIMHPLFIRRSVLVQPARRPARRAPRAPSTLTRSAPLFAHKARRFRIRVSYEIARQSHESALQARATINFKNSIPGSWAVPIGAQETGRGLALCSGNFARTRRPRYTRAGRPRHEPAPPRTRDKALPVGGRFKAIKKAGRYNQRRTARSRQD